MRECKSIEEVRENIDKRDNQIGERPLLTSLKKGLPDSMTIAYQNDLTSLTWSPQA